MKVIDLLNKIANGEIDYARRFDAKVGMNYCDINAYFERYPINENYLNVEIDLELLEEEKKIPEKLEILQFSDLIDMSNDEIMQVIKDQRFKINEIIDYLKSKGE